MSGHVQHWSGLGFLGYLKWHMLWMDPYPWPWKPFASLFQCWEQVNLACQRMGYATNGHASRLGREGMDCVPCLAILSMPSLSEHSHALEMLCCLSLKVKELLLFKGSQFKQSSIVIHTMILWSMLCFRNWAMGNPNLPGISVIFFCFIGSLNPTRLYQYSALTS